MRRLGTAAGPREPAGSPLIALTTLARQLGRTPITLWRWRKLGWLHTINVAGKQYVTAEALVEFKRRAERGEFAKALPKPPGRGGGVTHLAGVIA